MIVQRCNKGFEIIAAFLPTCRVDEITRWPKGDPTERTHVPFVTPERHEGEDMKEFQIMELAVNTVDGARFRLLTLDGKPVAAWRPFSAVYSRVTSQNDKLRRWMRTFVSVTTKAIGREIVNSEAAAKFFSTPALNPIIPEATKVVVEVKKPVVAVKVALPVRSSVDYVWPIPVTPATVPIKVSMRPPKVPARPHKLRQVVTSYATLYTYVLKGPRKALNHAKMIQRIAQNGQRNAQHA
jgi:hypothetical protein